MRSRSPCALTLTLLAFCAGRARPQVAPPAASAPTTLYAFFASQATATLAQLGGRLEYPSISAAGEYGWLTSNASAWTAGYFPGLLLQLHNQTGDAAFLAAGRALTYGLAPDRFDTGSDNAGYVIFNSLENCGVFSAMPRPARTR